MTMDAHERALRAYRPRDRARSCATSLVGDVVVDAISRSSASPTVVEFGSGAGELAHELATRTGVRVLAIDIAPAMVEAARRLGVDAVLADSLTWLQAFTGKLDVAVACDFIEHLDRNQQLAFFDELAKKLDPSGLAVIKTVNARGLFSRQVMYDDMTHRAFLTPVSASQLAELAGLRVDRVVATEPRRSDRFGFIRLAVWRTITWVALAVRMVETGKRQRIWTENMIVVLSPAAARCVGPGKEQERPLPDDA